MKLSIFLFLLTFMQVFAIDSYSQKTKLSLDMNNATVEDVLNKIEDQSEFFFLFSPKMVDVSRKVNIKLEGNKIDDALNQLFNGTEIAYLVIDRQIVLSSHEQMVPFITAIQQEITITGKVTDEEGNTLPGVNIIIKGTLTGTITDVDGNFSIEVEDPEAVLVFTFIGMLTQEIKVGDQTEINITMAQDIIGLEEVVAIGYGTLRKSDLTGAIFSIKTEKLQDIPNTNILQGLQGNIPGLVVANTQSAPGASPQIRIRGENSLSASNNPLIILDGIPFEGNLNDISTNDIESASVLKDASAAAIYGARAANGVIIITTKRGKEGRPQINYSGYFGVQTPEKILDMMDGSQYFQLKVDVAKNKGNVTDFSPEAILNSAELPQYYAGTETDWQDLVLRTAPQHEHNLSVSGGSDRTAYYTSLGFLDQKGIMKYSGMKRVTLRSNIDHEINDWLKTGVNLQLTNLDLSGFIYSKDEDFPGKLPDFADALRISPYGQLKDNTGRYTFYPEFPNTFYAYTNPFANDGSTSDNVAKRAIVTLFGEIDFPFLEGLSYRLNYGLDYRNQEIGNYWPSYTYYGFQFKGIAETNNDNQRRWTWDNILKYTKDIGDHHINFTGLFSRESFSRKRYQQEGRGFINDDNLYQYLESADSKEIFSSLTETDLVSYMARINYNFKYKYFLTATGRRDGYSGFGKNNKYGFFPSVALGWIPTQEGFMQNAESLKFIDYLKIRVSFGENGNMGISPYQTLDAFRTRNYVFGNNPVTVNGLELNTVGNPDLKWESTFTFNIGIDYVILNSRISGTLDYYQSHSNDLLMTRRLPVMNGYTSILYNIGETENKGFEFNLNTINMQKNKFEWTTNLNFSLNRDKIVELRGDGKDDLANNWFIGEPLRVFYDYNMVGIWQTGDDIADSHMPSTVPGSPKLEDVNSDGKLTADDRIILGSQLPSWVGGMTNIFSYGNWSLSVFINTVQGILKIDNIEGTYIDVPYWREDRPSNEFKARGITEPVGHGTYRDASYVRIKNASLSYNFPKKTLDKLRIANLRLYLSGQNLYTFTDWLGFDPEADKIDVAYYDGPYPNPRTIVVGINLGF